MNTEILQLYIEGKLDQQTKENVAKWLDADKRNMDEFLLLRSIYDAILWSDQESNEKPVIVHGRQFRLFREMLKITAMFILALGCSYFLLPARKKMIEPEIVMQTVYVPEGQRAEIFLADGTIVWLNAKTSLSFPNKFTEGERRVKLNGEAFFDVERDESKHFIVATEGYQVKVLGTEFNIKAYSQNKAFETALLDGSVEVLSNYTNERVTLIPNTYVYVKDGKFVQATLQNHDQFLWKEGIIAFENELVKDILEKLELYYDVKIDVQNTQILNYPYIGKFRTKDGVEHALKVLQLRHKFTYTKDNETNTIVIR